RIWVGIVTHVCHPWINKYFIYFSFSLYSSFSYAWFRFLLLHYFFLQTAIVLPYFIIILLISFL
ncbi:hypothetical protein C1646_688814, partial [Rhizophagus diaphanus]